MCMKLMRPQLANRAGGMPPGEVKRLFARSRYLRLVSPAILAGSGPAKWLAAADPRWLVLGVLS